MAYICSVCRYNLETYLVRNGEIVSNPEFAIHVCPNDGTLLDEASAE